jgi:ketosteroid isomerase-like protein
MTATLMESPRDVVLAWVDAFNRRDADAAATLYH